MRQSHKFLATLDNSFYRRYLQQMLMIVGFILFFMFSRQALANPFATPDNFDAASCPTDHKKYTIANTASTAPSLNSWIAGKTSQTFTFEENSGNKIFTINFSSLIDANNSDGTVPFYGSNSGVSSNAINLVHNSTRVQKDHTLDVSINRPVSKVGYKIQDLDSTSVTRIVSFFPFYVDRIPYIEQVDVSADNGRLTFNDIFHNINEGSNIVKAKDGENCSTGQCTIDATWGYHIANKTLNLAHSNEKRETSGSHATGYSDFYFCLAPPKVLIKKQLSGARINDTDSNRDQFSITINNGATAVGTFDTLGSGKTVTNNSGAVALTQSTTYTITERVINSQNDGDIANYNASYTCSNATTGSKTAMPKAAMTYDAAAKTRSFTLANTNYGDEITCTITNTPSVYTFLGTVFNDNGGLSGKTSEDKNGTFIGNTKYFNGKLDTGESGIFGADYPDLKVSLTNCAGTNIGNTTAQTVSSTGKYSFTVPSTALNGINEVCMVQTEPNAWDYTVDTTPIKLPKTLENNVYNYDNLNFGKVITEQTALVLKKYQYVHQCAANLNYTAPNINGADISSPNSGFSINNASGVKPGQCIAYKIEAYNLAHVALTNIRITDILQKTPIESRFHLPIASGIAATLRKTNDINSGLVAIGDNGVVITEPFELNNTSTTTLPLKRTLYFNTKYGTTVDP